MKLPVLPTPLSKFISYVAQNPHPRIETLLEPYKAFESRLREIYAQDTQNPAIADPYVNTVPIFGGNEQSLTIRARDLAKQSQAEKDTYLLTLSDDDRKPHGSPAIVQSLKDFRANFNVFSESSLVDLDWNNVVAAGSSVVTSLLPIKEPHDVSKRALRRFYHEQLAPASDVDLFIYGLDERQAIEKIKHIESRIRDSILSETTTIRTKNAITIVSEYPTRHVQIVLRLYKSVSEILTGFDVDCSCVAYDGSQVWASPRALAAFITQINTIDLTRRSPSYENRLSKYSHRGFEVHWQQLDRSRIDPTIFERSFSRVMGLARLLVLEKLPHPRDRDEYLSQRRAERGRPELHWSARWRHKLPGNIKDRQPDDVAEWVEEDEVSSYHTFTIPYGPKYNAKKINKLLFTKDLLLNAEWNRPKDRETSLHRHPAFFGSVDDVVGDCCGYCPEPVTDEDLAAAEEEGKIYISGGIKFIEDDPGRQAIGSFHPLTDDDWTDMAYVGNTARLCQAIVDGDIEHVQDWCNQEGVDINRRDHTGRTPLHLATMCSTLDIVQCLIDNGARLVARVYDGFTALHIAAQRGEAQMVAALLKKSEGNEEEEARLDEERKAARRAERERSTAETNTTDDTMEFDQGETSSRAADDDEELSEDNDGIDMLDSDDGEESDRMTEGSFVRVRNGKQLEGSSIPDEEDKDEPDVYDVNVLAWDLPVSPLHLAIVGGHVEVIHTLVEHFGADVLLPVKLLDDYSRRPREALLTLVLAMQLPLRTALNITKALLSLGASSSQANMDEITALHYVVSEGKVEVLDMLFRYDSAAVKTAINHLSMFGGSNWPQVRTPLLTAIRTRKIDMVEKLLSLGAEPSISYEAFARTYHRKFEQATQDPEEINRIFEFSVDQPISEAVQSELIAVIDALLRAGADPAILTSEGYQRLREPDRTYCEDKSLLDHVRYKIEKLRAFKADKRSSQDDHPRGSRIRLGAAKIGKENEERKPQLDFDDEAVYLDGLTNGTYRYWLAETDLYQAKAISALLLKEYEDTLPSNRPERGAQEKLEAIHKLADELELLEQRMTAAGAKTFYEMHPDAERVPSDTKDSLTSNNRSRKQPEPYRTDQNFLVPDITPDIREGYFVLFQAAWEGDIRTIKKLTLSEWGAGSNAPLLVTALDLRHFSPFSLAMLRGHFECAKRILDIATVQYTPNEKMDRFRYSLQPASSDDESDSLLNLHEELVDTEYTIEDISTLSGTVKSKTSPLDLVMNHYAELWRFVPASESDRKERFQPSYSMPSYYWGEKYTWDHLRYAFRHESLRAQHSLTRYAIIQNKMDVLTFLLERRRELRASANDDSTSQFYNIPPAEFDLAVQLSRNDMLGEMARYTGIKLPLSSLAEKSGVEIDEKPKSYQGLSVYGKKRKDWADASRGVDSRSFETLEPPLIGVIFAGNLEPTEYFLSDAPLRRYKEFASYNRADPRIATLLQSPGGIDKALSTWLTSQLDLTLHIAVMAEPTPSAAAQLSFLLASFPQLLNHAGHPSKLTPLALAFQLRRISAARKLLELNAAQTIRDISGRNLLHIIVQNGSTWSVNDFRSTAFMLRTVIDLLDASALKDMFLQRCSLDNPSVPSGIATEGAGPGSTTPLALYLHGPFVQAETLKVLLDYSDGVDLTVMDGAGDYPLHVVARQGRTDLAKIILERNPKLLHWENATGMTPYDVVQQGELKTAFAGPPSIPSRVNWCGLLDRPAATIADEKKAEAKSREKRNARVESAEEDVDDDGDDDDDGGDKIGALFRRTIRTHPREQRKRHLVTLYDANEVAKRLARRQTEWNVNLTRADGARRRDGDSEDGGGDQSTDDGAGDVLGRFVGMAEGKRKWDVEELEREGKERRAWRWEEEEEE